MSQDIFHRLVNIASRIHHTEASRSDILSDLASISEQEYKELAEGKFTPKEEPVTECKKCGGKIFDNNHCCLECGEIN